MGEKTGWTYIDVPAQLACQLKPNNKKAFRVKGIADKAPFEQIALVPMGDGDFILPLKAAIRKLIGKGVGEALKVTMTIDDRKIEPPADLLECLADEPKALEVFTSYVPSHQRYFINHIQSAKTPETRAKRIAQTVNACSRNWDYGQMIRA